MQKEKNQHTFIQEQKSLPGSNVSKHRIIITPHRYIFRHFHILLIHSKLTISLTIIKT